MSFSTVILIILSVLVLVSVVLLFLILGSLLSFKKALKILHEELLSLIRASIKDLRAAILSTGETEHQHEELLSLIRESIKDLRVAILSTGKK